MCVLYDRKCEWAQRVIWGREEGAVGYRPCLGCCKAVLWGINNPHRSTQSGVCVVRYVRFHHAVSHIPFGLYVYVLVSVCWSVWFRLRDTRTRSQQIFHLDTHGKRKSVSKLNVDFEVCSGFCVVLYTLLTYTRVSVQNHTRHFGVG